MKLTDLVTQLVGVAPFNHATPLRPSLKMASKAPAESLWKIDLTQLPVPALANLAVRIQSIQERFNCFQWLMGNRPIGTVTKALQLN